MRFGPICDERRTSETWHIVLYGILFVCSFIFLGSSTTGLLTRVKFKLVETGRQGEERDQVIEREHDLLLKDGISKKGLNVEEEGQG